jgi:hypothetical protein
LHIYNYKRKSKVYKLLTNIIKGQNLTLYPLMLKNLKLKNIKVKA